MLYLLERHVALLALEAEFVEELASRLQLLVGVDRLPAPLALVATSLQTGKEYCDLVTKYYYWHGPGYNKSPDIMCLPPWGQKNSFAVD